MLIPVLGLDPSLRSWGIAEGQLDLETGVLTCLNLTVIETVNGKSKQVRQNSKDLESAEQLAVAAITAAKKAKVIFAEVPVGSQSASAMKSYGVCIGVLAAMRALGLQIIEVTPTEVKKTFTGDKNATKEKMIETALEWYPTANFPRDRGKADGRILAKAEHVADAIAAIHAGVQTPVFQNVMRLFAEV